MYFCIENFAKLATANQNFYLTDSRLNFRLIQLISISKTEVAEEKISRAISHSSYELMLEISCQRKPGSGEARDSRSFLSKDHVKIKFSLPRMACSEKKCPSGLFSLGTLVDSPAGVKRQNLQSLETKTTNNWGYENIHCVPETVIDFVLAFLLSQFPRREH